MTLHKFHIAISKPFLVVESWLQELVYTLTMWVKDLVIGKPEPDKDPSDEDWDRQW